VITAGEVRTGLMFAGNLLCTALFSYLLTRGSIADRGARAAVRRGFSIAVFYVMISLVVLGSVIFTHTTLFG
jgi:hypothetical protein